MKRFILSFFIVCFALTAGFSQEYGYVNFGNLLSLMPGTEAAQVQLDTLNNQLMAKGRKMITDLQTEYRDIESRVDEYTPIQLREIEARLQKKQQEIAAFERQIPLDLDQRRQELLGPLIQQARDAIDAVAKEKGLNMVFDSSLFNALLFTEESSDLLPAVKAKLGIQ